MIGTNKSCRAILLAVAVACAGAASGQTLSVTSPGLDGNGDRVIEIWLQTDATGGAHALEFGVVAGSDTEFLSAYALPNGVGNGNVEAAIPSLNPFTLTLQTGLWLDTERDAAYFSFGTAPLAPQSSLFLMAVTVEGDSGSVLIAGVFDAAGNYSGVGSDDATLPGPYGLIQTADASTPATASAAFGDSGPAALQPVAVVYDFPTPGPLVGDCNRDGAIDGKDYAVWRNSLGDSVVLGEGADGDSNGVITTADLNLWAPSRVATLPVATRLTRGDFNSDGVVDAADYTVWRDGLGVAYDTTDYVDWASNYGTATAAASQAAPEPRSGLLVLIACGLVGCTLRGQAPGAGPHEWPAVGR